MVINGDCLIEANLGKFQQFIGNTRLIKGNIFMSKQKPFKRSRAEPFKISDAPDERIRAYIQKIATGPNLSKDLTRDEAEDGLTLLLEKSVSDVRAAVFLIASRIKIETADETLGYWWALDRTTKKQKVKLDRLLQIADAFDGFQRIPYFGFYAIPVIAELGLPAYGLSALPLPPKHGITFEDMLINHYGVAANQTFEKRKILIEQFGFGFLGTVQCHSALEGLRHLREEVIKRTCLSTLEKMLIPLQAKENFLATHYFHKGFETSMLEVAKHSPFDTTLIGNGMEATTLYGVHKKSNVFIQSGKEKEQEKKIDYTIIMNEPTVKQIQSAFTELKAVSSSRAQVAGLGEAALNGGEGPAASIIGYHAATLCHLVGQASDLQTTYDKAIQILNSKTCYQKLMEFLEECKRKD